jgi:hypothetical protein
VRYESYLDVTRREMGRVAFPFELYSVTWADREMMTWAHFCREVNNWARPVRQQVQTLQVLPARTRLS